MSAKEMIYQETRKIELLDSGQCCNYNYYILNLGTHPTAYIEIPRNHKCYIKSYNDIDIEVHGGLTYSKEYLYISEEQKLDNSWFIGWDYAHCGDYLGYEKIFPSYLQTEDKKWTTEEIQQEVFKVCKQLEELWWDNADNRN